MDEPLNDISLQVLDQLVMNIVAADNGKFTDEDFDSEITDIAFSVIAEEPRPENIYDRLDLSNDCLSLAAEILRARGHTGFGALLETMIDKNEIALALNPVPRYDEPDVDKAPIPT
jgi:hypothetical protein